MVCLFERKGFDLRSNRDFSRKLEELDDILSRAIRHTEHRSLRVDQGVVELGNRAHGDAGERDGSSFCEHPERLRDQPSGGREDDRAVKSGWGIIFCPASPVGS